MSTRAKPGGMIIAPAEPACDILDGDEEGGSSRRMLDLNGHAVGVLIVNWNSGPLLARCLDALALQTLPPARVLVVDNASSDGSEAAAAGRTGVEVLTMPSNLGFAEANNLGVDRLSDCDWVALLNPDAFAEPNWLSALMAEAGKDPDVAALGSCQLMAGDVSTLDGTGDMYSVAGLAWRRHHGAPASVARDDSRDIFGPCAAAALYRRDAFVQLGGFDRTFFCYFEDVDLAFRLRSRGYRCVYVPEAVVRHVGSALSGFRSDFAVFHGQRNMVWTFVKNMPASLLALYLPHHVLVNLVGVGVLALRGQGQTALRAKWAALRGIKDVLRARRRIQAERRASASDLRRAMIRGIRAFGVGRNR